MLYTMPCVRRRQPAGYEKGLCEKRTETPAFPIPPSDFSLEPDAHGVRRPHRLMHPCIRPTARGCRLPQAGPTWTENPFPNQTIPPTAERQRPFSVRSYPHGVETRLRTPSRRKERPSDTLAPEPSPHPQEDRHSCLSQHDRRSRLSNTTPVRRATSALLADAKYRSLEYTVSPGLPRVMKQAR
jgi:hypothetical protein